MLALLSFGSIMKYKFISFALSILCMQWIILTPVQGESEQEVNQDNFIQDAIVKIYVVNNEPDYYSPWRMLDTDNLSGSGAIISGNQILTNAHVIANYTFVQVRRYGKAKRFKARVVSISHETDLALLTVDDEEFFVGITPLDIGDLPQAQQEVFVYGYPAGGDSLSVTKGILSRIEHHNYVHSSLSLLAGQIDAAINPGSSGGPVLVNDKIVGVVMQGSRQLENTGYMVPSSSIKHFLMDIKDGEHDGIPNIGILSQKMENPDLKRKYKMSKQQTGLLINQILLGSPTTNILKINDILLSINGHDIADDGTIEFRPKERTNYTYYVENLQMGDRVSLEYLRQGKIHTSDIKLNRRSKDYFLVDREQYDNLPRFFIYGGVVFSPLTKNFLQMWGEDWRQVAPENLLVELSNWPSEKRQEVVIVVKVLAHDINEGYHKIVKWIITEVNGKKFQDFNEFYRITMTSNEPYTIFKSNKNFLIVIERKKALENHEAILKNYQISKDRSSDLENMPIK